MKDAIKKLVAETTVSEEKLNPISDYATKEWPTYVGKFPKEWQKLIKEVESIAGAKVPFIRIIPKRLQVALPGNHTDKDDKFKTIKNPPFRSSGLVPDGKRKAHDSKEHTILWFVLEK